MEQSNINLNDLKLFAKSNAYWSLPLPIGGNMMIPLPFALGVGVYLTYHLFLKGSKK